MARLRRLRRLRRWWPVAVAVFLALFVYAAWPGRSTFTIGPETTSITDPRDAQGLVDYQTALNDRLGRGVTPETNANVLIWKALGPRPEGGNGMPPEYLRWLGIDPPPEQGEYFLGPDEYFQAHLAGKAGAAPAGTGEDDPPDPKKQWDDRLARARKWPWQAADEPEIADWLKRNERPLAVMIEASKRGQYFHPRASMSADPLAPRLVGSLLPNVYKSRQAAMALCCRAMARVAAGDIDAAWEDLLACQRLGRLVARGGSLIEHLCGIPFVLIASDAELSLLSHARPSSKQALAWLADLRALPPMPPLAESLDLGERFMVLEVMMTAAAHGMHYLEHLDNPRLAGPPDRLWDRLFTRNVDWDPAFRKANQLFDEFAAAARLPDRPARRREFARIVAHLEQASDTAINMTYLDRVLTSKARRGELIGDILFALLLPAVQRIANAADRTEQTQRNLQVAFALAAYRADAGRYPARLAELAPKYLPEVPGDLFSGGPLIWRPEKDGYLFYSVGVNGLDEDGRWTDDDPKGDDLRVRMPVPEPKRK